MIMKYSYTMTFIFKKQQNVFQLWPVKCQSMILLSAFISEGKTIPTSLTPSLKCSPPHLMVSVV